MKTAITWVLARLWRLTKYYVTHPLRAVVDLSFTIIFIAVLVVSLDIHKTYLNSQITDDLVDAIDRESTFKRSIHRGRASKNPAELTGHGAPEWLRKVSIRTIIVEARQSGLDNSKTAVLLAIADRESGFNPLAKAPHTTACGLFQFIDRTGKRFGLSAEKCMEPDANTRAEIKHFKSILRTIEPQLKKLDDNSRLVLMFRESYCKHHDGEGAKRCSNNADATVAKGLKILLTSYNELERAQNRPSNVPEFSIKVLRTIHKGYIALRETVASLSGRRA